MLKLAQSLFTLALMANENLELDGRDGGLARRMKVVRHVSRFLRDLPEEARTSLTAETRRRGEEDLAAFRALGGVPPIEAVRLHVR